jgi:hypothetical protein
MARTARLALAMPIYALLAAIAAVTGLTLFVLSQNLPLAGFLLSGSLPLDSRFVILAQQYPFVGTNYDAVQGLLVLATAGLIGVNAAMLVYHLREHALSAAQGTTSVAGVVLGTLGAGCAACGSAVLAGMLSLFGATASLTFLPLDGLEFALVAFLAPCSRSSGSLAGCAAARSTAVRSISAESSVSSSRLDRRPILIVQPPPNRSGNDSEKRSAAPMANVTDRSDASDPEEDITETPIDDWEAVVSGLERFAGEHGEVTETDGGVSCEFGNARFEIRESGIVYAGMPLHDLDGADARALRFDFANGAITVLAGDSQEEAERFEYTFRRP